MYDEFENKDGYTNNGNGTGYGTEPENTQAPSGETGEVHRGVVQHTPNQQQSFYHYSYNGEQQGQNAYQSYQSYQNQTAHTWEPAPEMPEKKPKKKNKILPKFVMCASLALVFGVVASASFLATDYVGNKLIPQETEAETQQATSTEAASGQTESNSSSAAAASTGTDIRQVAKNALPSVVAITNKGVQEVQSMFFGTTEQETESSGSGVIIDQTDDELLIATNNHVVDGAEELSVCFTVEAENPEDAIVKAQVKGTDPTHDLAVVAVSLDDISDDVKSKIKVIEMGDSDKVEMGQQVVAIGNALGYGQSLTGGYISALNRDVTIDGNTNQMLQTDAAINFGNSGGALLDTEGKLIGINSAKAAASGVEGMGYAIPINTAKPILDELMNRTTREKVDESEKGFLGITPADVTEEARQIYSMPAGAFVYEVQEDSAAEKAGIKKGDIITKVDGISITSRDELFNRMDYYKAGETIDLVVQSADNGEYTERTVTVTLGERPADDTTEETSAQTPEEDQQPEEDYGYSPFEQFFGNGW